MAVATRHHVLHEKISIASKQYSLESVHVFALQVLQLIWVYLATFGILDVSGGGFVPIFREPIGKLLIGLARQAPQLVGIGCQEHPFWPVSVPIPDRVSRPKPALVDIHRIADEREDIIVIVLPFAGVMGALADQFSPCILAVLWLALHSKEIRQRWAI